MGKYTNRLESRDVDQVAEVLRVEPGSLTVMPGFGTGYDGKPDWLDDLDEMGTYCTSVVWGGGYLSEPDKEVVDSNGGTWKLVGVYQHGAEVECPGMHYDHFKQEDTQGQAVRKVTRRECVLVDKWPKGKRAECYYCEARVGEEHGYIYIGEGYEAVYQLVEEEEDAE